MIKSFICVSMLLIINNSVSSFARGDEELLSSCYRFNAQRDGYTVAQGPRIINNLRWKKKIGKGILPSPTVSEKVVYCGGDGGILYALDAIDGGVKWTYDTKGSITSSPAVSGGRVFVGDESCFYAIDKDSGQALWRFEPQVQAKCYSAPCVYDSIVYFGTGEGTLYALSADGGEVKWSTQLNEDIEGGLYPPTVTEAYIAVLSETHHLHIVDRITGKKVLTEDADNYPLHVHTTATRDRTLYVPVFMGMRAVDLETMEVKWFRESEQFTLMHSPTVWNERVLYSDSRGLKALDAESGKVVWEQEDGIIVINPIVADDVLYGTGVDAGNEKYYVYSIEPHSGTIISQYEIPERALTTPAVCNKLLYVTALNGYLYALGGE